MQTPEGDFKELIGLSDDEFVDFIQNDWTQVERSFKENPVLKKAESFTTYHRLGANKDKYVEIVWGYGADGSYIDMFKIHTAESYAKEIGLGESN